VSNPTVDNSQPIKNASNFLRVDKLEYIGGWVIAIGLFALGIVSLFMPAAFLSLVLNLAVYALIIYGCFSLIRYFYQGRASRSNLVYGLLALLFSALLLFNNQLPEWIIRTCFGWYCLAVCIGMLVQILIHRANGVKVHIPTVLFCLSYGVLFVVLMFTQIVDSVLLMRLFGIYFILLAIRDVINQIDLYSSTYSWKRGLHVSLPLILGTLLPDMALREINEKIRTGRDYAMKTVKRDVPAKLKCIVHIGAEGFQKVGHFTFSWKGLVYSYGNYDKNSERFFSMFGDGVYFTVPEELYFPNLVKYEHNTLFEYTIQTTPEQDEQIEQMLDDLKNRSIRWYCDLEKTGTATKLGAMESDYPCRLHYRTGAKYYKIKSGMFKTYWVVGDNCVLFSDVILGSIGADVLSLRGIITPGSYFDYLEQEYVKENSPIIERRVHSWAASQVSDGI